MGSSFPGAFLALAIPALAGCGPSGDPPLIVATTWPASERTRIEASLEASGDHRPISWVVVEPWERLEAVVDRRGGVDLLLGLPALALARSGRPGLRDGTNPIGPASWRVVRRPGAGGGAADRPPIGPGDPRTDPAAFARAKSLLAAEGWPRGYEALVRLAGRGGPAVGGAIPEFAAPVRGGPNPARAGDFLRALEALGLAGPPGPGASEGRGADDLLADLLGSSLVDSLDELREADAALARSGHPARAEAALGEAPPWPPASVARLRLDPNGEAMVATLLGQVAPDPECRAWLSESWSRPRRPLDGALLAELAGAADGKLALEPRFRGWLRGEWTAWTRQLYRRVARVAGGYVPS